MPNSSNLVYSQVIPSFLRPKGEQALPYAGTAVGSASQSSSSNPVGIMSAMENYAWLYYDWMIEYPTPKALDTADLAKAVNDIATEYDGLMRELAGL